MIGPLEGIKVLECAEWLLGPAAGTFLGDLGADVIKIEQRLGGDPARGFLRLFSTDFDVNDERYYAFDYANRNKRSITLDLKKERGRQILYKLVEKADVFLHNFRLHVPKKLGIDYETLSRHNPRLIYSQISGWGPEGPSRLKGSFEPTAMAVAGTWYLMGEEGMPPLRAVAGYGDQLGAVYSVVGILAALLAREKQGIAQCLDTSLLGSLIALARGAVCTKLTLDKELPRRHRAKLCNPLNTHYKCGDDKWIVFCMPQADRYWPAFCKTMSIQKLEKDPRFETMDVRNQNSEGLISILDGIFATKTRDEWMKLFEQEGSLIYAPIQTISEAVTDPQVLANEYVINFAHPNRGPIKMDGFPTKFSKTPLSMRTAAPYLGQHTEEVLLEIGYTWDDIAELRAAEVI